METNALLDEQKRAVGPPVVKPLARSASADLSMRSAYHRAPIVSCLLLFLIALVPRTFGLADFFTTDEAYHWIDRVAGFSYAVGKGRWAETVLTGHPGVTIMWLGSLGQLLQQTALGWGWIDPPTPLAHLAWLRLPAATLQALLVPVAYLLLRRLVMPTAALVAALLWATSPYLIAHSRLLHLDALLTIFVTLSLLALLGYQTENVRTSTFSGFRSQVPWLLSALFGGLALLTKGPALILLPCIGLVFMWLVPARTFPQRIWRATLTFGLWIAVAAVTVVSLWPVLWVAPRPALTRYLEEITANGGRPNGDGQFFLGAAVGDPGPLFYPVANAFRSTPEMLVGLFLALGWAIAILRRRGNDPLAPVEQRQLRNAIVLTCFVCFWTLVMTIGPKKFDRYVLPTWPALLILAAIGLGWAVDWLQARFVARRWLQFASLGLLTVITLLPLAIYHPYYLSYYNPLLGGGSVAQRTLLIGWGEGMEQVGAFLRTRPDIGHAPVASALGETLRPFLPVPINNVDRIGRGNINYAVVYLESAQRGAYPEAYAAIRRTVPLRRITIHGIDYADIHQVPRPFEQPLDAQFGPALHLWGVTIERTEGKLTVTPSWDVRERLAKDYTLFIHLIDANGTKIAQIDAPPVGDGPPTSEWEPGQQFAVPFELFPPSPLPPGRYDLVMGLYDDTGTRLPLLAGPHADPSRAGPNAVLLQTIES